MIVTTARKQADALKQAAMTLSKKLNGAFVEREGRSIRELFSCVNEPHLIVAKNRLMLYATAEAEPLFYHPNAAFLRYKQWCHTGIDPFIRAADLRSGDVVIDATLGMAADATIAQLVVGPSGSVTGLEVDKRIACIVSTGLRSWREGDDTFLQALQAIKVVTTDSLSYLSNLKAKSVDVVYFDPMFENKIDSPGLAGLKHFASYESLTEEMISQAVRVARKTVVLKDHVKSERFDKYGFSVKKRQHASFQYGVIDVSGG